MKTQLKLALKVLARRKPFTAISLFGISLTLAVLMVATSILDPIFYPGSPETHSDRTLLVTRLGQYGPESSITTDPGYAFLDRYVRTLPGIERASIFSSVQSTAVHREGARIEAMLRRTDGEYWQMLDVPFLEGAPYAAADDESGRLVAVINADIRERLFNGELAVGRTFEMEGRSYRVVGVVPRPKLTQMIAYGQIWVPIGTLKSAEYREQLMGGFTGAVRVRDRRDIPALRREFERRLPSVPLHDPKQFKTTRAGLDTTFDAFVRIFAGNKDFTASTPRRFAVGMAVVALLFMALPALNLITLNLSRILERGPEIGVRRAFGAPRGALVRQFVFENIVMTLLGGVIGFAVAGLFLAALNRLSPLPDTHFALNLRVFAWGMLLAAFFGALSGVYPAWRMSRLHPVDALRGGSK